MGRSCPPPAGQWDPESQNIQGYLHLVWGIPWLKGRCWGTHPPRSLHALPSYESPGLQFTSQQAHPGFGAHLRSVPCLHWQEPLCGSQTQHTWGSRLIHLTEPALRNSNTGSPPKDTRTAPNSFGLHWAPSSSAGRATSMQAKKRGSVPRETEARASFAGRWLGGRLSTASPFAISAPVLRGLRHTGGPRENGPRNREVS